MLYRTLKRMIERGQLDGMDSKLDIFFVANRLTQAEYLELTAMLGRLRGDEQADV